MNGGGWAAQIPDESAKYLRGLMDDHVPNRYGFCQCCKSLHCTKAWQARVELAAAGRLDPPPAWAIPRPEPGRWP